MHEKELQLTFAILLKVIRMRKKRKERQKGRKKKETDKEGKKE